ncbi:YceI family protein [Gemmatimonadota bacterium]
MQRFTLYAVALLTMVFTSPARSATWEIDGSHSSAQFRVTHLMISEVSGSFSQLEGKVSLEGEDITSAVVEATIKTESLYTGSAKRDDHLKGPDFFDVEKYPDITFRSIKVTKSGDGSPELSGQLAMHGVTRDVVLAVETLSQPQKDPWGNTRVGLTANTIIQRKDFGISWNKVLDNGGVMIGEDVKVTIHLELIKQQQ